jgi:hypothetical protein
MLFDGFLEPVAGKLRPDLSRPGHGLELKSQTRNGTRERSQRRVPEGEHRCPLADHQSAVRGASPKEETPV